MPESIRLVIIAGIRPQFIKMAALLNNIEKHNQSSNVKINTKCINTGQHYDSSLSTRFFQELNISFDFEIVHKDRNPDRILANTFYRITNYLKKLNPSPDWIVVFGDGNPSMVGAIATARQGYGLVHIEAGEKRGKYEHEEINRRIIDSLSDIHFCVSKRAVSFLAENGISKNVYWTGDLAYEFTMQCAQNLPQGLLWEKQQGYILATIHRPENLEEKVLKNITAALNEMSKKVFFLCHPRLKQRLQSYGLIRDNIIQYLEPLSYLETLSIIKNCAYLFSDSGGIIREASHLGKRCIVRRNNGAWPELVETGLNIKVGTSISEIFNGLTRIEILCKQDIFPSDLLYRQKGVEDALNLLCDIEHTKTLN